jgi:HPt (histidine-containing phosphotransfer) domain-containing protein
MTANAMSGDSERCLAAGMNAYLSKPIQVELMYTTLARFTRPHTKSDNLTTNVMHNQMEQLPCLDAAPAIANFGDEGLYKIMIGLFISDQGPSVSSIQNALDQSDIQTARRIAHTLKGAAATIGALQLAETAKQLEAALSDEETALNPLLMTEAAAHLQSAITSIDAYLKS